uniref:Uncharacterized protein n=1 Tax=Musa acuminata subsp. malaccensis TaxID=214687 RepID=A0A804JJD7_MUSAM
MVIGSRTQGDLAFSG